MLDYFFFSLVPSVLGYSASLHSHRLAWGSGTDHYRSLSYDKRAESVWFIMRKAVSIVFLVLGLIESISIKFWPPLTLIIVLIGLELYLYKFPNSRLIPFLTYWFGPYPRVGERQSNYLFRLSIFAAGILVVILGLIFLGFLFSSKFPSVSDNHIFMAIFAFGLPFLVFMCLLSALFCLIKALRLKFTGNDPYFISESPYRG